MKGYCVSTGKTSKGFTVHRDEKVHVRFLSLLCSLCLITSVVGCTDAGTDVLFTDPEGVRVQAGNSSLLITNKTGKSISVFAVEQQASALVDWIPLCDDTHAINQGGAVEKPYSTITGYSPGCSLLVYWWGCTPSFDGRIRVLTVKTKS